MPLIEAVTIEVGAAIAKSILKLWMKDSKLGDDISSSLIDLLKSRTSDALAQRRGQRQFDTIGEKVGESLLPLFEIEGAHLDEGSRIAVAHEVASAFNKSKLSSELLAKRNLEPGELARYVLAGHSIAAQPFSDAEKAFYQRIIEVSCAYIVDIASQLPAFTERTFAEVLKREDQLLARTDEILQEIRHVREQLNPVVATERFEIDYRLSIARKLDELQLVGADVSLPNRRHRLSVAYITLSVEQKSDQKIPLLEKNEIPAHPVVAEAPEDHQENISSNIVSVDTALTRSHRLLIRGLAGSGKTTLLQWIAVKSATKTFEGQLSDWNDRLPFYIRLRQCTQPGLPGPGAFPSLVVSTIADNMPKGWVHAALTSGRAIILIDGLDEISASKREEVRLWLKELAGLYPQARFIVTSRPPAIEEGWMDHEGFSDAELQPMQLSDISMFIDHWHKAVREELHSDEEKAELGPLAQHLKNEVRHSHAIRNLATNPLLCAMLCALNRERGRQMPKDRIELYEACCSLLLERRDQARNVDLTDYPALQLHYRQRRRFLEDLAYWMIKNGWSEVSQHLVDERFAKKLTEMQGIPQKVTGVSIRRLFVERTGIIREPVVGQIDFVHRTFQEFLAAQAASDEMDIGVLVANAHNDQWREVIILACGLASIPMREMLIKDLITAGDRKKKYRHRLHILAVSCLDTSVDLSQKVKTEVEKRLSNLVPPKNMADASSLAAAGELAVKYLAKEESYSALVAAACVRTLALIGGEVALDTLEGYATDTHQLVVDELLKAWDSFDRSSYAKRVLSKTFRDRSSMDLRRLPSLDGLQYFTHLTAFNLREGPVNDLSPLAGLTNLTQLSLVSTQVSDLSPLAGLTNLTQLNLGFT
ncbi:MAG: NACHT domain-containing protein, partial [Ktedonobacteraceae bacterium]